MNRQELKNLLRSIKPEGDISDIVDQIMELNGADTAYLTVRRESAKINLCLKI